MIMTKFRYLAHTLDDCLRSIEAALIVEGNYDRIDAFHASVRLFGYWNSPSVPSHAEMVRLAVAFGTANEGDIITRAFNDYL
jgi:hypothetical protein